MKKPFELNPNPETAGEAFRRIATDHGYPVGEDGKIVDSGFHPGNWPDGQPKEFIAPVVPDPRGLAKIEFADFALRTITRDEAFKDIIVKAAELDLLDPAEDDEPEALHADISLMGEHPEFTKLDWVNEVFNGDTILGYWEWVSHKIESEDTES